MIWGYPYFRKHPFIYQLLQNDLRSLSEELRALSAEGKPVDRRVSPVGERKPSLTGWNLRRHQEKPWLYLLDVFQFDKILRMEMFNLLLTGLCVYDYHWTYDSKNFNNFTYLCQCFFLRCLVKTIWSCHGHPWQRFVTKGFVRRFDDSHSPQEIPGWTKWSSLGGSSQLVSD